MRLGIRRLSLWLGINTRCCSLGHVILTESKGLIIFAQFTFREWPGRSNMTWPYTETKMEISKNYHPHPQPCCVIRQKSEVNDFREIVSLWEGQRRFMAKFKQSYNPLSPTLLFPNSLLNAGFTLMWKLGIRPPFQEPECHCPPTPLEVNGFHWSCW